MYLIHCETLNISKIWGVVWKNLTSGFRLNYLPSGSFFGPDRFLLFNDLCVCFCFLLAIGSHYRLLMIYYCLLVAHVEDD